MLQDWHVIAMVMSAVSCNRVVHWFVCARRQVAAGQPGWLKQFSDSLVIDVKDLNWLA